MYNSSEKDILTMPKNTEARLKANAKYDKKTIKGMYLKLNRNTDADIIEHLETVGNKHGYIKDLIRTDMKRDTEEE